MKKYFLIAPFFLLSCKTQHLTKFKCVLADMENTIAAGAEIRINESGKIVNNCIVAFKTPNTSTIKILRVLGSPGDEIEINKGEIYVNKQKVDRPPLAKKIYTVYLRNPGLFSRLKKYKSRPYSEHYSMFSLSNLDYREVLAMNIVDSIYVLGIDPTYAEPGIIKNRSFKYSNNFYFGPIKIPLKNTVIDDNILALIPLYLSNDDKGKKIKEDYYFCIGDNSPEAKDSRFLGLIPRSSILGVVDKIQKVTPIYENVDENSK